MSSDMKVCTKCGVLKPLDQFHTDKSRKSGFKSSCKACYSVGVRAYEARNLDTKKLRCKEYREKYPEKVAAANKRYAQSPKGREVYRLAAARDHKKFPERAKARQTLRNAIRAGKVRQLPCEVCGSNEKVQAHHDDYSKPLDVRWLCHDHHVEAHTGSLPAIRKAISPEPATTPIKTKDKQP